MREGLRAELPELRGLALHVPSLARERWTWAFLSGVGAGILVGGIGQIGMLAIYPALFPPTEPHPDWLTPLAVSGSAAVVVTSAVAVRAGGLPALGAYVAYEILLLLAAFPGRALFCERSGGPEGLVAFPLRGCDLWSLVTEHWPTWAALVIGVLISARSSTAPRGANWLLRGAGAYALVSTALTTPLGLVLTVSGQELSGTLTNALFLLISAVAGAAAGVLIARSSLAAALLLVIAIVAPTLSFTLPAAVREGFPEEALEFTVAKWEGVLIPMLTAAALLGSRAWMRTKGGTFS